MYETPRPRVYECMRHLGWHVLESNNEQSQIETERQMVINSENINFYVSSIVIKTFN